MQYVVTKDQMRQAEANCDRDYITYRQLMENAGIACAEEIIKLAPKGCFITILCGSGNNGGDGFVISKVLAEHGISSGVILINGQPGTDCAAYHLRKLTGSKILDWQHHREACCDQIVRSDLVVDCIYGTGFHGELSESSASAIRFANNCPIRIAIDVPSGINSDTGEMDGNCFKPTHTLMLAAIKAGMLSLPCNDNIGITKLLDIGIDENCYEDYIAVITDETYRRPFSYRRKSSHKGTYGRLLNIAGCLRFNGAAAMSTKAALRTGVGLCTLAAPKSVVNVVASAIHETTYLPLPETEEGSISNNAAEIILKNLGSATAISIGCGMGNSEATRKIVETVIKNAACPIIIDADGINSIAANIDILKERKGEIILTPHVMEYSRISGMSVDEIQSDRINAAKNFAEKYGVTMVLKGANTVIATAGGEIYVNTCGNSGLAKGGSGDVLTGMIAAMAAQGIPAVKAAVSGVYCHSLASDLLIERMPPESMLPSDVIAVLPEVYRS